MTLLTIAGSWWFRIPSSARDLGALTLVYGVFPATADPPGCPVELYAARGLALTLEDLVRCSDLVP
jgi:hypothetical protein